LTAYLRCSILEHLIAWIYVGEHQALVPPFYAKHARAQSKVSPSTGCVSARPRQSGASRGGCQ